MLELALSQKYSFSDFHHEVKISKIMSGLKIGPTVYGSGTFNAIHKGKVVRVGYIIMERFDSSLTDLRHEDPLLSLVWDSVEMLKVKLLCKGYIHQDLHNGNILVRRNPFKVVLSDFTQVKQVAKQFDYKGVCLENLLANQSID
jgi:serine/threonine protein kinase